MQIPCCEDAATYKLRFRHHFQVPLWPVRCPAIAHRIGPIEADEPPKAADSDGKDAANAFSDAADGGGADSFEPSIVAFKIQLPFRQIVMRMVLGMCMPPA